MIFRFYWTGSVIQCYSNLYSYDESLFKLTTCRDDLRLGQEARYIVELSILIARRWGEDCRSVKVWFDIEFDQGFDSGFTTSLRVPS